MSLDLLYGADIEANYRRQVFTPKPAPETSFSLWSMAGAGLAGFPGAGLEVTGSAIDLLGPADRAVRSRPRPAVLQDQPAPRQGEQVTGDVFRAKAAEFAPDPQTAHVADQVMYGLTRFGAKAAAAMLVGGPAAGSAVLAAEETNTAFRGLLEKGVDSDTALLTGMVAGVVNAAGVALPVSGAALPLTLGGKAAATAGLVAVGGPVSFVAQEMLARDLLQRTGYDLEAATHDPTNPLGLALSVLLPGLFGAVAMRGAYKGAMKTEADVKAAVQMSPAEQAASDAYERSAANLKELRDAIAAEKRPEAKQALQLELMAQEAAALKAAPDEATLDAARVVLTERALTANLPDRPDARGEVLRAMDEVAAGRMPDVAPGITRAEREANFAAWFGDSKVVDEAGAPLVLYHGTARDFESFDPTKFGANTRATNDELGFFFTSKPFLSDNYAELAGKGGWNNAEPGSPVVYPVHLSIKNPKTYKTATEFYRDGDARAGNHGAWREDLIAQGYDGVVVRGDFEEVIVFDPKQAKSAIGNSGKFDPNSASLTDPLDAAPPPRAEAESQTPRDDAPQEATAPPEAPHNAIPRDLKAEAIALRKAENLLAKLLECVT